MLEGPTFRADSGFEVVDLFTAFRLSVQLLESRVELADGIESALPCLLVLQISLVDAPALLVEDGVSGPRGLHEALLFAKQLLLALLFGKVIIVHGVLDFYFENWLIIQLPEHFEVSEAARVLCRLGVIFNLTVLSLFKACFDLVVKVVYEHFHNVVTFIRKFLPHIGKKEVLESVHSRFRHGNGVVLKTQDLEIFQPT